MKVTITYQSSEQVGPESWDVYTKVIHLREEDTIGKIYEKHFKGKWHGDVNVELHLNIDEG